MLDEVAYQLRGQLLYEDPFVVLDQLDQSLVRVDVRLVACLVDEEIYPLRGVLLVGFVVFYGEFQQDVGELNNLEVVLVVLFFDVVQCYIVDFKDVFLDISEQFN